MSIADEIDATLRAARREAEQYLASKRHRQRQRKPTLASALKQANKAGAAVSGATLAPDGSVSLTFGEGHRSNGPDDLDRELEEFEARHEA
jgi:hypothetical protein